MPSGRPKNTYLKYCECGGVLQYSFDFGRAFVVCLKCTLTVTMSIPKRRA